MLSRASVRCRAEQVVDGVGSAPTTRRRTVTGEVAWAVAHRVAPVCRVEAVFRRGRGSLIDDVARRCWQWRRSGHWRGSRHGRGPGGGFGLREGQGLQKLLVLGEPDLFADRVRDDQIIVLSLVSAKAVALHTLMLLASRGLLRAPSRRAPGPATCSQNRTAWR